MSRTAAIRRQTAETQVSVELNLDGSGLADINTGVGFFDHMLTHLAKHGFFDLRVAAQGDRQVDDHHLVEDVGIVFGLALREALGDKRGIVRFGWAMCPLDDALVTVALDLAGRAYLSWHVHPPAERVGAFDTELAHEFFGAFVRNAQIGIHVIQQAGDNTHHVLESAFKSLARALSQATRIDQRLVDVPSTKGTLT